LKIPNKIIMTDLHSWLENIWWQSSPPPLLLRAIEPAYAAISRLHLQHRFANLEQPSLPIISVGNITAGGSGKTPFVIWLAHALREQGHKPVILCRGDGGKAKQASLVQADDDPALIGDEARLLADISACPVFAAQDRVAGSRLATEYGDILILDDGFQYRQLHRICDIVLIPAEGVGNGHTIPAGPLREPISALTRADIVVRTGKATSKAVSAGREWNWSARPIALRDAKQTGAKQPKSIFAAAGIARPQRFFDDLSSLEFDVTGTRSFPDHHRFDSADVRELTATGEAVAVTAKDAVKLAPMWPENRPLWVLDQQGEAESGLLNAILEQLESA
jgi:tetraacyldisaccharide 4'-kinase